MENRVLVVHSDFDFANFIRKRLEKFGFLVSIAKSPLEGIEFVEKKDFDVVIIDGTLTDKSGKSISACKYSNLLKRIKAKSDFSIVLLSPTILSNLTDECEKIGIDEILYKPVNVDTLIFKVKRLIDFKNIFRKHEKLLKVNDILFDTTESTLKNRNIFKLSKESESLKILNKLFDSEFSPDLFLLAERYKRGMYKILTCEKGKYFFCETTLKRYDFYKNFFKNSDFLHTDDTSILSPVRECIPQNIKVRDIFGFKSGEISVILINPSFRWLDEKLVRDFLKNLIYNFEFINTFITDAYEISNSFKILLVSLAKASEANDEDTGYHVQRIRFYCELIAEKLVEKNKLDLTPMEIELLGYSAIVHDVGKIHIDPSILFKKGKLTEDEMNIVKKHTIYGAKIIGKHGYLKMAREIALTHHERFDGTGYPFGLKGEEIPISGRIVAIADVYDALRSDRPYKRGFSHEKALKMITEGDGRTLPTHFDPDVLDIFIENHKKFDEIFKKHKKVKKKKWEIEIFEKDNYTREDFKKLI